jgi:hypothetical protein
MSRKLILDSYGQALEGALVAFAVTTVVFVIGRRAASAAHDYSAVVIFLRSAATGATTTVVYFLLIYFCDRPLRRRRAERQKEDARGPHSEASQAGHTTRPMSDFAFYERAAFALGGVVVGGLLLSCGSRGLNPSEVVNEHEAELFLEGREAHEFVWDVMSVEADERVDELTGRNAVILSRFGEDMMAELLRRVREEGPCRESFFRMFRAAREAVLAKCCGGAF